MEYRVRASSWSSLLDCAHRFEAVNLLGMKSVSGLRATLGTAIHASTALYDLARTNGADISAMDAAAEFIDKLHNPEGDVDYRGEDLTIKEAERIGLVLHSKYCQTISPRYEFVAIEMTANPLVIDIGGGHSLRLTGSMDRARIIQGEYGVGIGDLKTGKMSVTTDSLGARVAKTAGHTAQLGTYEILYEHTTGQAVEAPAEIVGLSTGARQDVATGQVHNAKEFLLGSEGQPGVIEHVAQYFRSGLFVPNPQSSLCSGRWCPRHSVCKFKK